MVYTVTFNPSLDYIVTVDDFKLGLTNRTRTELMLPGGKGINVSWVLGNLDIPNYAIYFSAGFVGDEITRRIRENNIHSEEIRLDSGCSRINLKLKSIDGTEINGMGPDISEQNIKELYDRLDGIKEGDVLVLAGSIPSTMPQTIYSDIMKHLEGRGIKIVVDATKNLNPAADAYWEGKNLHPLGMGVLMADQIGETELRDVFLARMKKILVNWFTYAGSNP